MCVFFFIQLDLPYILIGSHFLCLLPVLAVLWPQPQQVALTGRGEREKRGSCQPSCCHSSAWFHTGVYPSGGLRGEREQGILVSGGKWHGPAFLGLLPFSSVCFKKRLGFQLVFFFIFMEIRPLPRNHPECEHYVWNSVYGHVIVAVNYLRVKEKGCEDIAKVSSVKAIYHIMCVCVCVCVCGTYNL